MIPRPTTSLHARHRLLVVADGLDGGLGAVARQHAIALGASMDVTLAAPGTEHVPESDGVDLREIALPDAFFGAGRTAAVKALRVLVSEVRPDIVHAHGNRAFMLARMAGTHPCVTLHGLVKVKGGSRLLQAGRDGFARAVPLLARRAWSVSPDAPRGWVFLPHASPRLAELSCHGPADRREFAWMGRLSPQKRPEMFIEALDRLGGSATGVLYGDGERTAELEQRAVDASADVRLAGHVDDVSAILRRSRALVLLSHYEGVPLVVQEAMWSGLPVVLSPLPGNRWLAGDTALYARDADETVAALRQLLDVDEARRRGAACAARIRSLLHPFDPWVTLRQSYEDMIG